MKDTFRLIPIAALCFVACAVSGDPKPEEPPKLEGAANTPTAAIDARDVAIFVLEQTPSSLHVISVARRPRSSFGPSASWNGSGTPTHIWSLLGPHGQTLASGEIVARTTLEAPPNPEQGSSPVNIALTSFSFDIKVPQPASGETIEITPVDGSVPSARWP